MPNIRLHQFAIHKREKQKMHIILTEYVRHYMKEQWDMTAPGNAHI